MRRLAALIMLTTGCALHGTVPLGPSQNVLPPLGINAGYHGPLPPDVVTRYCGTTIRTPQLSAAALQTYYDSIAACPSMRTVVLVEGPDVMLARTFLAQIHDGDHVEAGNELELAPHSLTVAQYASFLRAVCDPRVITGGVYTLNDDTKPYLLAAAAACPTATLGVHLYEDLSDADLQWLRDLHRPLAVTEFGAHTNCDSGAGQKAWIETQWAAFARVPAMTLAVIYQQPVGPTCSDADTFGIAGQPAEGLFR